MRNHKANLIAQGLDTVALDILNVVAQWAGGDLGQKRVHFPALTFRLQLDSPVGEVPHPADHLVAGRDSLHGVAKAHALDPTRIKYLEARHPPCLAHSAPLRKCLSAGLTFAEDFASR